MLAKEQGSVLPALPASQSEVFQLDLQGDRHLPFWLYGEEVLLPIQAQRDIDEGEVGEDQEEEWDPENTVEIVWPDEVNIGANMSGHRYEGDSRSYVPLEDFFKPDATLIDNLKAVYFETEGGFSIVRVEQDGTWTKVEGPYPNINDYRVEQTQGRVAKDDLEKRLEYSDGTTGERGIFFDGGFGPLATIEAITTIPIDPLPINPRILAFTEDVDVVERFSQNASLAAIDPVI
ncbi:MAG: hypothetical protein AAB478_00395 [Patescibacteria group bacterium]